MVKRLPVFFLLTCIFLASLGLKLLSRHMDPAISRDGCLYIRLAQIWYDTDSFQMVLQAYNKHFSLPPLPLYLMKCLMYIGLSAETAGVLINLIAGAFTPLLTFGIAYEVTQRQDISLCSAMLIAVNPSMNKLSIAVQRDMIYLFFAGLSLWLLVAGIRRQKRGYWLGAGFACSCAMLTRFETLEFLAIVPLSLLILFIGKYCSLKKAICYAGIYFLSLFGVTFFLLSVMKTQDIFLVNYEQYYQEKIQDWKKQFDPEKVIEK